MQKCPVKAITMQADSEGFLYPSITDDCIGCRACIEVCPIQNATKTKNSICDVYAVQLLDQKLLRQSTSGGVFILLTQYVLDRGGCVFGASYDENMMVRHTSAEKLEDVFPMQGSKYVQSDTQSTYSMVAQALERKRHVLYTGTPRQVEGLIAFLGNQTCKDNLITLDIICGGVPSPLLFAAHIANIENRNHTRVIDYKFRDK